MLFYILLFFLQCCMIFIIFSACAFFSTWTTFFLLFLHEPHFFLHVPFSWLFNDSASSSATPNCFPKFLPWATHNWIGMVDGFLSGQILSWVTHIFIMSLCHAWASISLRNEGKDTVSRLKILAVWAYMLKCLQQSHKMQHMYIIFLPIPYWGIVGIHANNEQPLLHQLSQPQQQLLVCDFIDYISRETFDLQCCPQHIFWFCPISSSLSFTIHLLCKTQQTNVKCRKKHCKSVYKNRKRKWAVAMSLQDWYSSIYVRFIFQNISCTCHALFSMQKKQLP